MKQNRFLLFAWGKWEARGGWGDFEGSYDSQLEAKQAFDRIPILLADTYQIVDSVGLTIIEEGTK